MRAAIAATAASALLLVVGCDDSSSAVKERLPAPSGTNGVDSGGPSNDGGPSADGGDGGPTDCVMNPKTHAEIINACTTATKIAKDPVLPKLRADGGLPPLQ